MTKSAFLEFVVLYFAGVVILATGLARVLKETSAIPITIGLGLIIFALVLKSDQ